MSVSQALEKSAKNFCSKYACRFDFDSFESSVEEFTFLRPVGGWVDAYKTTFDRLYKASLEQVALGSTDSDLDPEAMLDDFEYTLIRPYINEGRTEIRHKPYVGMDRLSRLAYLDQLTKEAPSNLVDLYADKYKRGELSIKLMRSVFSPDVAERKNLVEAAGYAQALENVNKGRSLAWRALHPFKNSAEKRRPAQIKKAFLEGDRGGEELYQKAAASAYQSFERLQRVGEILERDTLNAKEELDRTQKMSEAMRESIRIEELEKETPQTLSPRVDQSKELSRDKRL